MLDRIVGPRILERLSAAPAVALIGPRQCGKTTLARSLPGICFDLERQGDRVRLDARWEELTRGKDRIILDEAQTHPEVFPRLRAAIDDDRRRRGRFLLLGSIAPELMRHVTESLAGRLALVNMSSLLLEEARGVRGVDLDRHWLVGGFPDGGILKRRDFPSWQDDYVRLLAERDLPTWGLPARPQVTMRLFRMLASLNGQIWNASQVGQSLGLSYHTVNSYLDWLEGCFLIRRLHPWSGNLSKRLVKAPRIYWRDSGLLHAILQVQDEDDLLGKPWVGASFEGFAIEQVLAALEARGLPFTATFFRTHDGHEIDLVLEIAGRVVAVEVKLTTNPSPADARRLESAAEMIGAGHSYLVSRASEVTRGERITLCPLDELIQTVVGETARRTPKRSRRS